MSEPNLICPACGEEATLRVVMRAEIRRTPKWDMTTARWIGVSDYDQHTTTYPDETKLECYECERTFPIDDPNVPHA